MKRYSSALMTVSLAAAVWALTGSTTPLTAQGAEPDWSKAQMVTITMSNYAFEPKSLHLKSGMPYKLHFANSSGGGHNFDAKQFFAALNVAAADKSKIDDGKVEVDAMSAVDIDVVPTAAGTYPVTCSHFLHSMMGMKGEAVIE
jgi:plastocyanin